MVRPWESVLFDLINGLYLFHDVIPTPPKLYRDKRNAEIQSRSAGSLVDFVVWIWAWLYFLPDDHCIVQFVVKHGTRSSINSNNPRRQDLIMCKANSTLNIVVHPVLIWMVLLLAVHVPFFRLQMCHKSLLFPVWMSIHVSSQFSTPQIWWRTKLNPWIWLSSHAQPWVIRGLGNSTISSQY